MRPLLTLDVIATPTDRVRLIHRRDGEVTSTYDLPAFPRAMRLLYEQLTYTIRDIPYRVPVTAQPEEVAHA